jgi:hypothetical protein
MNPIFAAALELQEFLTAHRWRFCIIGGVALQRWGEPRLTQDVDLTLLTGFGTEAPYVDALLGRFRPRGDDARAFALANRVLLLQSAAGIPLDIALGAMPFEERAVERATPYSVAPDVRLITCGAEDLIVFKVFAGRPQDWLDVEGIALRQGSQLNRGMIVSELTPLLVLKEDTEAMDRLGLILDRV